MANETITAREIDAEATMAGIGMTTVPPYAIWRNGGEMLAEYETLAEVEAGYHVMRGDVVSEPPITLLETVPRSDETTFHLAMCDGWLRLWKATTRRLSGDAKAFESVKFHITGRDDVLTLYMSDWQTAKANFEMTQATQVAAFLNQNRPA